jgi:hypothetical protein
MAAPAPVAFAQGWLWPAVHSSAIASYALMHSPPFWRQKEKQFVAPATSISHSSAVWLQYARLLPGVPYWSSHEASAQSSPQA